ncbi:outer membrane protein assembly factor BamB family protein [Zavarzinella formosa]|uniref:outer membrane protein assembly factor BamB family protein n=1 Tax=Zavarzinella formosa TaxID=360055 RepID=UPI0003626205|nr:PQQ-binding-like beta-propeller repeat protein [Zavarzinella formosa]
MIWIRIFLVAFVCGAVANAGEWPQWRGPKNDGHSAEKDLPAEWDAEKNIVWKLKMPGIGAGTPAVWGDKVFVTSVDGDDVVTICVGTDGKEKWKAKLSNTGAKRYKNPSGADVSDASASCSTDGKHVWAFAGNGSLACFTVDGALVWATDVSKFGKIDIAFGAHWTPVLHKDKLYLQVMHRTAQKLVRYDAFTGKEDWAVDRAGAGKGESPDVYASAFIWEGQGGPLLISHGNDFCTAHRLTDGGEVWRVQGLNPTNNRNWRFVSDPLVTPDLIVVPSCKNGPTVGVNPVGAKGDITPDNRAEVWRIKTTPDVVSPIRVGDVIFLCGHGPFTLHDAKTGDQIAKGDITKGYHWANMVAGDGKIYATSQEGVTDVLQAGREFKKLATNKLPDKIFGSPAIAGGRLYFRGYGFLWAIGPK